MQNGLSLGEVAHCMQEGHAFRIAPDQPRHNHFFSFERHRACSGQAIMTNPEGGIPLFDREKCVHCGACLWNCSHTHPTDPERGNVNLQASTGGFHSAEN